MKNPLSHLMNRLGKWIAGVLSRPRKRYFRFTPSDEGLLETALQPGDILLVEGNTRISSVIQYLSQSTWSHACFYTGPAAEEASGVEKAVLIEADLVEGVIAIPLSKYTNFNTRICRPIGLKKNDLAKVSQFILDRLGHRYDLRNIFDLLRYFLPTPPVHSVYRRRLIAFGSGDPSQAICSTLIAQAFQQVRYPILPRYCPPGGVCIPSTGEQDHLQQRHFSHFTPRDFDSSPYFQVIKPTLENGFDFHTLEWDDQNEPDKLA